MTKVSDKKHFKEPKVENSRKSMGNTGQFKSEVKYLMLKVVNQKKTKLGLTLLILIIAAHLEVVRRV